MISRKSRSFCLQTGPPPLSCRRLLRVPDIDHVAQFLLSQQFKKLSQCSTTTAAIIDPYWAEKRGSHLQPCKHSGPLVAKAVHLHRSQLLLGGLLINLLLHLPLKFFLLLIIFLISQSSTASFRDNNMLTVHLLNGCSLSRRRELRLACVHFLHQWFGTTGAFWGQ